MALSQEITAPCLVEGAPERDVGSRHLARRVKGIDAASSFLDASTRCGTATGSPLGCPRCGVVLDALGAQRAVRCPSCNTPWRAAPIHLHRSVHLDTIRTASWLWIGHGAQVTARIVEVGGGMTLHGALITNKTLTGAIHIPAGGTFIGSLQISKPG